MITDEFPPDDLKKRQKIIVRNNEYFLRKTSSAKE
jgi:hypothetical protein